MNGKGDVPYRNFCYLSLVNDTINLAKVRHRASCYFLASHGNVDNYDATIPDNITAFLINNYIDILMDLLRVFETFCFQ